ncbi:MAG: S1/P1 nuclease [Gammaproteobacteria bacterium]|nr:S1/P1 nuclease [Gammaproteobacteria bacterium]
MTKKIFITLVTIGFLSFHFDVSAFGKNGHRTVGLIAEQHLTETAKLKVKELLGDDSLAEVSVWADFMRSDPHPLWQKHASSWHYVNLDDNISYQKSRKNTKGDIYQAINTFIAILKDEKIPQNGVTKGLESYFGSLDTLKEKTELKQFALKFLIHLIGDLHQPLHVGYYHDLGGNKVDVKWFGKKTNLHRVWDEHIIDSSQLSFSELADFVSHNQTSQIASKSVDPLSWLNESLSLRKEPYQYDENNLGYQYYYQHYPLVKQQLYKAGIRLADCLNQIFK